MSISVERYTAEKVELWNDFVKGAVQNSFLFQRQFMDYHQDRFQDHSVMIYDDSNLVAVLPANQVNSEAHTHGGLSYGGFLIHENLKLHHVLKLFFYTLRYFANAGISSLIYKTYPSYLTKIPAQSDQYALFLLEANLIRRDPACLVDLLLPLSFQQRRVRSITKAASAGAWMRTSSHPNYFWSNILTPTLWDRHQLKPVHSLDEIILLMGRFPKNIKLYECGVDDFPSAGVLIFEKETTWHAQYIATTQEGRKQGTLDFLFDRLLHEAKKSVRFFSFGISVEQQGKVLNTGLQDWKEGFGSRTVALDYYKVETSKYISLANYA